MPNFQTHYTFVIEVKGDEAIQQAQQIGTAIGSALKQTQQTTGVATFTAMTKAMQANVVASTRAATAMGRLSRVMATTRGNIQNLGTALNTHATPAMTGFGEAAQAAVTHLETVSAAAAKARQDATARTTRQTVLGQMGQVGGAGGAGGGGAQTGFAGMARLNQFTTAINEATKQFWGLRRLGFGIETLGRSIENSFDALGNTLMSAANAYLELDTAASRAEIALRIQDDLVDDLREGILDLSVEMALLKPGELAEGMRLWAEGTNIQIRTQEDLNQVLETAASIQRLVVLNNGELAGTTEAVGAAMNEFGLNMSDVTKITEGMNFVAQTTFASLGDIGDSLKLVGPLAAQVGDDFTTVTTAIGILADVNIRGSMAGRALRQTYRGLTQETTANNKAMNQALGLSEDLGNAWRALVFPGGKFIGLDEFLNQLAVATQKMTTAQQAQTLSLIATANELPALIALVEQQRIGQENGFNFMRATADERLGIISKDVLALTRWREAQEGVSKSAESATEMYTRLWDELEQKDHFRAARMRRRWESTFIAFGEDVVAYALPAVEDLGNKILWVTDLIERIPGMEKFATQVAVLGTGLGKVTSFAGVLLRHMANLAIVVRGLNLDVAVLASAAAKLAATGGVVVAGAVGLPLAAAGLRGGIDKVDPTLRERMKTLLLENERLRDLFKLAEFFIPPIAHAQLLGPEVSVREDIRTFNYRNLLNLTKDTTEAEAERARVIRLSLVSESQRVAMAEKLEFIRRGLAAEGERLAEVARLEVLEAAAEQRVEIEGNADIQIEGLARQGTLDRIQGEVEYRQFLEDNANRRVEIEADTQQKILELNMDTQQRIVNAISSHLAAVARANRDFALREGRTQADATRRRAKENTEFQRREAEIAEDLLEKRQEATEDFQRDEAKAARDHHVAMQRLERDHRDNLIDLLEARDVQGIVKEMRAFRRRRQDAEEDFQQGRGDRQTDFARNREEDAANAEEGRLDRRAALQRRQDDEDEAAALSAARRKEDFDRREADRTNTLEATIQSITADAIKRKEAIRKAADDELTELQESIAELERERGLADFRKLKALHASIIAAEIARRDALIQLGKDTQAELDLLNGLTDDKDIAFLEQLEREAEWHRLRGVARRGFIEDDLTIPSYILVPAQPSDIVPLPSNPAPALQIPDNIPPYGGRQSGGYVSDGLFRMHANEFVLNQDTTSFLERRFGHLNQGVFTSGQGLGGGDVSLTLPMTFHGTRRQDADYIRKVVRKEAMVVINEASQRSRGNRAYPF